MISKDTIKDFAEKYYKEVLEIREHIHQYPELSFQEFNTSEYIAKKLDEYQIPFQKGIVKTGIIAKIKGKNPGKKTVVLRADIDALPIIEENNVSYKSKNEGVMHACGHDVHSASLLVTAKILNELKDDFDGQVILIFQPGEEKLPGGASLMLKEGILENENPVAVIAQHVQPGLETGKTGFRAGMYMASADEIYMTVKGKGGHAAMPHQLNDPVLATCHIIVALQQITSRNSPAPIPTVLSFGKVIANGATNVIPPEVKIEGTFRTMNEEWREKAHERIKKVAHSVAESAGCSCDIDIRKGYPVLVNHPEITLQAKQFAENYLGKENVVNLNLRMTAEDFAYFSQDYPAVMYRLGISNESKNPGVQLHSSHFDIDEEALKISIGTLSWITLNFLQ